MSLRSAFIGITLIIALCGGGLYVLQSYFGREAQMRSSERTFLAEHVAGSAVPDSTQSDAPAILGDVPPELARSSPQEPMTLDSWYADAGAAEGPVDTTPEDKSYLINDAKPLIDVETD
jgi:hypothetical protein